MSIEELGKQLEELEKLFPRKKFPAYAKVSTDVWEELKRRVPIIISNNPIFEGLTIYVERSFAPKTIKIYNIDREEINDQTTV